jgi:sugar phosphate isomerase/epimerase
MDLARISTCSYPVRELPVADALRVLAAAGVRKVDLWGNLPHFSIVSTECDLETLRDQAAAAGVGIANLGSYPGNRFGSDDPLVRAAELQALKATLCAAKALGARSIRVMPGRGEDPALVDRIAPLFADGAQLAEELDVYMGMENHAGSIAEHPEVVKRLCRAVGSDHFGVLYEPCNLMHGGVDYKQAFAVFADHVVHVHVKDGRDAGQGWEGCHLGEGDLDYGWVIAALEGLGYQGDYALEYEICDLEAIETGLPRWVEYFRGL